MNNSDYPKRHWSLKGRAQAGKSTFVAANAATPLYIIDADGRSRQIVGLVQGKVITPTNPRANLQPWYIWEGAEEAVYDQGAQAILIDSVTRIYSVPSRNATMGGKMTAKQREDMGLSKNAAALQEGKSTAINVLANLTSLQTELYYIWHVREGVGPTGGKPAERDVISKTELEALATAIDVNLELVFTDGKYGVRVLSARDLGGRPSNFGFTMWDAPNNRWRGAAARLETMIYTTFSGQDEAIAWGRQYQPEADHEAIFRGLLQQNRQATAGQLWSGYVDAILYPEQPLARAKAPVAPSPVTEAPADPMFQYRYGDGSDVSEAAKAYFDAYRRAHDEAVPANRDELLAWYKKEEK